MFTFSLITTSKPAGFPWSALLGAAEVPLGFLTDEGLVADFLTTFFGAISYLLPLLLTYVELCKSF